MGIKLEDVTGSRQDPVNHLQDEKQKNLSKDAIKAQWNRYQRSRSREILGIDHGLTINLSTACKIMCMEKLQGNWDI